MRTLTVRCEVCGREKGRSPRTWWTLEEESAVLRTSMLDFCALWCLLRWLCDRQVRQFYKADFPPGDEGC
jgi:hypothetical protein